MQFGSDNQTGASEKVLKKIIEANSGYTHGYGNDDWTQRAVSALKDIFECELDAFFVATGTAANSLALSCLIQSWESVLCHAQSHINMDESTAPEFFSGGGRLVGLSKYRGKIEIEDLNQYFDKLNIDVPHSSRATALSLTQASEVGQVYTPQEISAIAKKAHAHGLQVHMDGARFSNALVSIGCTPAEMTWKAGVDVLCLGASKNGALAAEAVIFFKPGYAEQFIHRRKRAGHLLSKGRLFGAQFVGWLENSYWLELARHANSQASKLSSELSKINGIRFAWPTQANEIMIVMPTVMAKKLQDAGAEFYEWYLESLPASITLQSHETFVRLVTSFQTSDQHISEFCEIARS